MIIEIGEREKERGERKKKRKKGRAWNRNKTNEVKAIEVGNWWKRRPIPFLE